MGTPALVLAGMTDLGTLGGTTSTAYGINDLGQIVGQSYLEGGPNHAFLYTGGVMLDLGTLDLDNPGGTSSRAYAINNSGQIVGRASTAEGDTHAFLYVGVPGAGGVMHDLGTLVLPENAFDSEAHAINNSGQIVGWSMINANPQIYHAFRLYGTMADLGTLGEEPVRLGASTAAGRLWETPQSPGKNGFATPSSMTGGR
jgi:probable HAF family extracellular repeat protein